MKAIKSKKPLRIGIIGDESDARKKMAAYLNGLPAYEVAFDCDDAELALITIESQRADILLVDIHLPNMNGAELVRHLHATFPKIKTLLINAYDTALASVIAQEAGANGVISKDGVEAELLAALDAVSSGIGYWPTLNRFPDSEEDAAIIEADNLPMHGAKAPLSPREMEVFLLLGTGKVTKQIATALGLSARTVDVHRASIKRKLGARSASEMIQLASLAYWVSSRSSKI